MFCSPGLIFGNTEGVGSIFHVLRYRTRYRRYRGRRVLFSCFALPDSFSAVPTASGPILMFCAPALVFGGTEGAGSRFQVLRFWTHFQRNRGCRVLFSCFTLSHSFSAVLRASGPILMFCAPALVFGGTEVAGSRFSSFALPDSFSAVPRASYPVFMFCALERIFSGTEVVGSIFHVLRSRTHFRRYRGRRVPFSCFVLLDSFSALPWASGPVFMFFAPGLVFGGTEGVRSLFHVFRSRNDFRRYRARRVPFSRLAVPNMFSAVVRASGPILMFCAPGLVFVGTECVESLFHVLRSRTHFRR
jgi:hypothetical protein